MSKALRLLYQLLRLIFSAVWALIVQVFAETSTLASSRKPAAVPKPESNQPSEASLKDGHEISDAKPGRVAIAAMALFGTIFATMAVLGWMYMRLYTPRTAIPGKQSETTFKNAPHSRTKIEDDWKAIDAQTLRHLDGYGWIDRAHGVARIPIQRAMELISKEGLPARPGQTPPSFPPPDEEKLPLIELETTHHATKFGPE